MGRVPRVPVAVGRPCGFRVRAVAGMIARQEGFMADETVSTESGPFGTPPATPPGGTGVVMPLAGAGVPPGSPTSGSTTGGAVLGTPGTPGKPGTSGTLPPAGESAPSKGNWRWWHTLGVVAVIVAMVLFGRLASPLNSWLASVALLIIFLLIAGQGTTGLLSGALIDERNKMSLSRLQMVVWTVLVLSAIVAAAFSNIAAGNSDPLGLGLQPELWLLMGISTTSLVGSPLIKSTKTGTDGKPAETQATFQLLAKQRGTKLSDLRAKGQIVTNVRPQDASLADLFKGEETGNAASLDLAKVQMLFFTVILALAYAGMLYSLFAHDDRNVGIHTFPVLSESMLALLGISHAGYLANKAVPHSTAAPDPAGATA
jgi:hypothetical protein